MRTNAAYIRDQVLSILEDQLQISLVENGHAPSDQDVALHLDSLALLELVVALEQHFRIHFSPDELSKPERFRTLGSLTDFLEQRVARATA